MNKITKLIVGVFCALLLATSAFAADTAVKANTAATTVATTNSLFGNWVATVGGTGATTTKGNSQSALGLNASLGRTLNLLQNFPEEVGVRQFVGYSSPNGGTATFSTKPYVDVNVYSFNATTNIPVNLFAGGNVGLTYGNVPLAWTIAPEVGVDVWSAKNVALDGRIEYPITLNNGNQNLAYFVGVKFTF